jgi:DNA (cytosine-5)-methyltransferase 1
MVQINDKIQLVILEKKMKIKVASFFAGVGGIDLGFKSSKYNLIYANELDINAVKTFESNFNLKVDNRDINNVKENEIPDFDLMLAGFPCQPFSIAGYREGFEDKKDRGNLFFQLIRIIKFKKPSIVLFENVKNLVSHDNGNTFRVILESLEANGYFVKYKVLNAKDYGNIPHGRERIYIVGFTNKDHYYKFEFPNPMKLSTKLEDLIDYDNFDDKYIYTPDRCSFFNELEKNMNNKNSIYQWRRVYVRENKSSVCPTLTANMGTGGHNVPLILSYKSNKKVIRKLTPRECFNLQGFPKDFILPNISNSHLYKQAGNSVVVTVIKRIAEKITEAVE